MNNANVELLGLVMLIGVLTGIVLFLSRKVYKQSKLILQLIGDVDCLQRNKIDDWKLIRTIQTHECFKCAKKLKEDSALCKIRDLSESPICCAKDKKYVEDKLKIIQGDEKIAYLDGKASSTNSNASFVVK